MKLTNRLTLKDREGETKIVRKYLLIPRSFGDGETRWLEYANIVYEVCKIDIGGSMQWGKYGWYWVPIGFADKTPLGKMANRIGKNKEERFSDG